jgi:hypothetical protein
MISVGFVILFVALIANFQCFKAFNRGRMLALTKPFSFTLNGGYYSDNGIPRSTNSKSKILFTDKEQIAKAQQETKESSDERIKLLKRLISGKDESDKTVENEGSEKVSNDR